MGKSEYISIAQFAKVLGISRIAIYQKIKKGQIKAIRIGRSFAIPRSYYRSMNLFQTSRHAHRIFWKAAWQHHFKLLEENFCIQVSLQGRVCFFI